MRSSITDYTFQNKLKVILAPNKSIKLVSIQLYVRMGSAWEESYESGFSHFIEHLVFKSTHKFPENSIINAASNLGGTINAYTEYDSTCYYLTLPSEFLEQGIEIISELVKSSNFSDDDFYYERNVILEEIKQYRNDPEDFFLESIPREYFDVNPYRKPILGYKDNLDKAKPEDLRRFYKKYYTPNNCFLILSGDFDTQNIVTVLDNHFKDWKYLEVKKTKVKVESYPSKPKIKRITNGKIKSPLLAFTVPELSEQTIEALGLSIITKIFTLGKKSRLYKRLYLEEKLIESIKVESLSGIYQGITIILILPKSVENIYRIIDIFLEEYNQIRHFGIKEEEITESVSDFYNSWKYSQEYIEDYGMNLGCEEIISDYRSLLSYPAMLKKINFKNLDQVIKKYYDASSLCFYYLNNKELNHTKISQKLYCLARPETKMKILNDYHEAYLSSGMKVILKKVRLKETLGISVAWDVSHLNEAKKHRGLNSLTNCSLLYGTHSLSYDQLLKHTSKHGVLLSTSSHNEVSTLKLKCFSNLIITGLDILCDIMLLPVFPIEHVKNLQKTYISNLDRVKDYPVNYASFLWKKLMFGPLSNLVNKEGNKTDIQKITRKQIMDWYFTYYKLEYATMVVVGNYNFDNFLFNLENLTTKKAKQQLTYYPGFKDTGFCRTEKKLILRDDFYSKGLSGKKRLDYDQSIIIIGSYGCGYTDVKKSTAFNMLAQIIGGDMNSRMFTELREKNGLAYTVGFDFFSLKNVGFFIAYAIVDKKQEIIAKNKILDILDDVRLNGISEKELEIAKNFVIGNRLRDEESVLQQARVLSVLDRYGFDYDFYTNRNQRVREVTTDDLKKIAIEYFIRDRYTTYILA